MHNYANNVGARAHRDTHTLYRLIGVMDNVA